MILVDTSVWIDHLRAGSSELESLLNDLRVLVHPFVIGELACGNLRNRKEVLDLIGDLPQVNTAADEEVLYFIEQHELMGKGIGYIDAHLLASVALTPPAVLWTRDIRLESMAIELKLCFPDQASIQILT